MTTTTAKAHVTEDCPKCQGKGTIRAYSHIHNGACFHCSGRGTVTVLASTVKARATRARKVQADATAKLEAIRDARKGMTVADLVAQQLALIAADQTGLAPHKATDPAVIAEVTAWCEKQMVSA
jgi:DnaJ-class molecular chaperone